MHALVGSIGGMCECTRELAGTACAEKIQPWENGKEMVNEKKLSFALVAEMNIAG